MSISAGKHKSQGRGIVQELAADVVILVQQGIAPLGLDAVPVIEKLYYFTIYYYYVPKIQSITVTGKSFYYILQLHITYY